MKFNELYDIVVLEAHRDAYTGLSKQFYRTRGYMPILLKVPKDEFTRLNKQIGELLKSDRSNRVLNFSLNRFKTILSSSEITSFPSIESDIKVDLNSYLGNLRDPLMTDSEKNKITNMIFAALKKWGIISSKLPVEKVDKGGVITTEEYENIMRYFDRPLGVPKGLHSQIDDERIADNDKLLKFQKGVLVPHKAVVNPREVRPRVQDI